MRANRYGLVLVLGAALLGACHADGPTGPRALYLMPDCSQGCIWGWGNYLGANSVWLRSLNGTAGDTLTIDVQVTDSALHTISGVQMRWTVVRGGAIDSAVVRSNSAGILRVRWALDTLAGADSLRGLFPSGDSVLAIASVKHGPAAVTTKVSGDSQVVALGESPKPFVIRLTDRYGNPVAGASVAWTVGGLGAVTTLTTTTDTSGRTSNTLRTPDVLGVYAVIATFGSVPALVFRVDAK